MGVAIVLGVVGVNVGFIVVGIVFKTLPEEGGVLASYGFVGDSAEEVMFVGF